MKNFFILSLLFILISCAKTQSEKVSDAIDVAQTYLSQSKCQDAIDVLEDVSGGADNGIYLQVLASAYSCRAGFSELSFIANDIPDIDISSTAILFKSFSTLSLSSEIQVDSDNYADIKTALNVLLDSAGTQPSHSARVTKFGERRAKDLSLQMLLLLTVQLGKFLNFFGNVSSTGVKGAGTQGTNSCFLNYQYNDAQNEVANYGAGNNCNSNIDGHPDLDLNTTDGKRRVCEGLVLFTNLLDVLNNLDLSSSTALASLTNIISVIDNLKDTSITAYPSLSTLLNTTSQSECEDLLDTAGEFDNIQLVYALIFEMGLE